MTEDEPKIDPSKIRVGDELDIRVKVAEVVTHNNCSFSLKAKMPYSPSVLINPADIIAHHPRQLQVGDKVKSDLGATYRIVAGPQTRQDGVVEYATWHDLDGFEARLASQVESWERVQ